MARDFRVMTAILTHSSIEAIRPPAAGRAEVPDEKTPGLMLRVSYSGSKTWVVRYRRAGKRRRYNLGRWPQLDLADARTAARKYLGQVADDKDPAQDRADAKAEPTFGDLAETYVERHANNKRPRGRQGDLTMLRNDLLPAWSDWKISHIKRRHIIEVLDAIVDRGAPIMANRTKNLISTIFRFAEDRGLIEYNPAVRLKAPAPKPSRSRVLDESELRRLFEAMQDEPARRQAIVRTALCTAARRGDILGMKWAELDGDVWTLPAARSKNGREHRIPLVPSVKAAIEALPRDGEFVFHSHRSRKRIGQPGQSTLVSNWFPPACRRAGIEGARFHDLRRTAATMMNKIGIDPIIIERCLNHVQQGVAAIYNRHTYDKEKRAALLKWEKALAAIVAGPRRAEVIPIGSARSR
jgi:integrase